MFIIFITVDDYHITRTHSIKQATNHPTSNTKDFITELIMFALNPDGESNSGGKSDPSSNKYIHFLKLTLYFVAIRAAHIYFGPSNEDTSQ